GMPNEEVKYINNQLYIDGEKVDEPFLDNIVKTNDFTICKINSKLKNDKFLVLGDNRGNSIDSRIFGLVSSEEIIGKVIFTIK
ncbi:MAG: signal peptidase I, partial [Bacilli bacterium]